MSQPEKLNSEVLKLADSMGTDWIDRLDVAMQDRVVAILDQYLVALEKGEQPSIESIVAEYPELAGPLRSSLESIRLLNRVHGPSDELPENRVPLGWQFPKVFAGFHIGRELGRGAMGVVFAARSDANSSEVAIKFLETNGVRNPGYIERFRREARAAESLNHPNIVPVYHVGCEEGRHYYTMKLIDGAALSHYIDVAFHRHSDASTKPAGSEVTVASSAGACASTQLQPSTNEYYRALAGEMAKVAEALHAAHTMGIVHRDIKPSNLLMDSEGRIWISDFGLAHVEDGLELTYTGDVIGTFQYMSPEQASGKRERIDTRSDIYSLGATLYELFTGQAPYSGLDRGQILQRIQTVEPVRPIVANRNLPDDLETIIRRAMRPDRADRYQSAALVAEDLLRFSMNQPVLAERVNLGERARNWAAAHSGRLAIALMIALLGMVLLGVYNFQIAGEKQLTANALRTSEINFRQARNAVDTLGLKFSERLAELPGSEVLRREVLGQTLGYYESFIASSNKDPRLAQDVAQTKLEIARLIRVIGTVDEANTAYQNAIESLRATQQDKPNEKVASVLHLALHEWIVLRSDQGDQSSCQPLLLEASKIADSMSDSGRRARAQALSHHTQAMVAFRQKDMERAIAESSQSIAILNKLDENLDSFEEGQEVTDSYLANAFINLSVMLGEAGRKGAAETAAAQGLALRRKVVAAAETPDAIKRLAMACDNSGSILWRNGRAPEAIEFYQQAIGHFERVIAKVSPALAPRRELSITLNNLGMAQSSLNRFNEADIAFRRAIGIAASAADSDTNDASASQCAAGMWNNLGVLRKNNGNKQGAADAFRKASEYQKRVCTLLPEHLKEKEVLRQIQANLTSL